MKPLLLFVFLFMAGTASAQVYEYYFFEVRPTGRLEVAIKAEEGVDYGNIDSLICVRQGNKVKEKKYPSYSHAFNALSAAGLEFVQFSNLPTVGGATAIVGDIRVNYMIWRRPVKLDTASR